jgi:flagellar biosynthetic protein FliR
MLLTAVAVAGTYVDTLIGFSSAASWIGDRQPVDVLSQLYALIGVMVFVAIGGDAWVLEGLARTYDAVRSTRRRDRLARRGRPARVRHAAGERDRGLRADPPRRRPHRRGLRRRLARHAAAQRVRRRLPAKVTVGLLLIGVSLPFVAGWITDELQRSVSTALQSLRVG